MSNNPHAPADLPQRKPFNCILCNNLETYSEVRCTKQLTAAQGSEYETRAITLAPVLHARTHAHTQQLPPGQDQCPVYIKLSLCFNCAPRHEGVLGEWKYSSAHSWTSALDGGEWSASRPSPFTPGERALGTRWIGGWVSPRAVLNSVVKRKIPSPHRESNPRTPVVQPFAQRYTD
jgi:hypothetical protein